MPKQGPIKVYVNAYERKLIEKLCKTFDMKESDALRYILRKYADDHNLMKEALHSQES